MLIVLTWRIRLTFTTFGRWCEHFFFWANIFIRGALIFSFFYNLIRVPLCILRTRELYRLCKDLNIFWLICQVLKLYRILEEWSMGALVVRDLLVVCLDLVIICLDPVLTLNHVIVSYLKNSILFDVFVKFAFLDRTKLLHQKSLKSDFSILEQLIERFIKLLAHLLQVLNAQWK